MTRCDRSRTTQRIKGSYRNSKERGSSACTSGSNPSFAVLGRPLAHAKGYSCSVGSKIKQGLVELPLAEVTFEESEMIQQCALRGCEKWETTDTMPRFKRCSKCKRRYYVRADYDSKPFSFTSLTTFTSLTICPACAVLDRGRFAPFALLPPFLCIANTIVSPAPTRGLAGSQS